MSVTLYTDHNVHDGIVFGLRSRGVDVLMAREDRMDRAPDDALLTRATELGRVLFTNDNDLLQIAREMQHSQRHFAGVLFAPQKGPAIGNLIDDLELIAKASELTEYVGRVGFEDSSACYANGLSNPVKSEIASSPVFPITKIFP
jgi:hypothetical protein